MLPKLASGQLRAGVKGGEQGTCLPLRRLAPPPYFNDLYHSYATYEYTNKQQLVITTFLTNTSSLRSLEVF